MKSIALRREIHGAACRPDTGAAPAGQPLRTFSSGVLFAGSSEVAIAHGGDVYRLRLTRQNRLILTK